MKVLNKVHDFFYETDLTVDHTFWEPYYRGKWIDGNIAYRKNKQDAMGDSPMVNFEIQNIKVDKALHDFVDDFTKHFGFKSNDFRCTFMKIDKGGDLPDHIDQKSKLSIVIPITNNTATNHFQDENYELNVTLSTACLLNTRKIHGVHMPTEKRLTFHVGFHDVEWDDIKLRDI